MPESALQTARKQTRLFWAFFAGSELNEIIAIIELSEITEISELIEINAISEIIEINATRETCEPVEMP